MLTDRAVESVREAMKAAEDCGVLFCVEVVNRFEHYMLNTAEEGVAFAKQVGSRPPARLSAARPAVEYALPLNLCVDHNTARPRCLAWSVVVQCAWRP